jgi:hypothetical protein
MRLRLFPTLVVIFAANFVAPSLVWADWVLTTFGAAQAACAAPKLGNFIQSTQTDTPNVIAITDGASSDGFCPGNGGGPTSASYLVHAAFNDVSGRVQVSLAGAAAVTANYTDDVTLHPPVGFEGSTVTFGMVANANLRTNFSGLGGLATALLFFHVLGRDTVFSADTNTSGNGSFSELLQTFDLTLNAPFTTEFQLAGKAIVTLADGNASASFSDPVTFILPPGWTYTLASQQATSAVPEPGAGSMLGLGILVLIAVAQRRSSGFGVRARAYGLGGEYCKASPFTG